MRIAANPDEVGHDTHVDMQRRGQTALILLNGEEVKNCFVADEAGGFVEVANVEDGQWDFDEATKEVRRLRLTGHVQIVVYRSAEAGNVRKQLYRADRRLGR